MLHLIYNPVSGKNKPKKSLEKAEKLLVERGVPYEVHETQGERDAQAIAKTLTESGEREIIVLGGDGTLHEVLNGLDDPALCTIGLLPCGTGNDFAERLGLPTDAEKAMAKILDGEAKPIDYLEVGGVRCMNVAGIGMDVDVLERCQKGKLKGKIKYFISLLQSLFAFKGIGLEMESEGRIERHEALIAAACNGSQFGGGIRICPNADVSDGKLHVVLVECIGSNWGIIKAFMSLLKGTILTYPATTEFLCERVKFTPDTPCTVQLDGELYKDLEFDVALKQGLKFYY